MQKNKGWKYFRYSGLVPFYDVRHAVLPLKVFKAKRNVHATRAGFAQQLTVLHPPGSIRVPGGKVPQWAPTRRNPVHGYDPAGDCSGNFMSSKFQANNNCYNYACNIATNSFAHPGRKHGEVLARNDSIGSLITKNVFIGAKKDGLLPVQIPKNKKFPITKLARYAPQGVSGHFVALLISRPQPARGWRGDFHWVRSDNSKCTTWSQKNGSDQVTNFDFAGKPIRDPRQSNWVVNQGPTAKSKTTALRVTYSVKKWMYVPDSGVDII